MKTISIFGATGRTGREFIDLALEKEFRIIAFCRNKRSMTLSHSNLNLIEGDLLSEKDVDFAVQGADFVVSAIGTKKPYTDIFCYEAMKNIVVSMQNNKVKRLICVTGAMIGDYPERLSRFVRFMKKSFNKKYPLVAMDRLKQEMAVKASRLDWTILKPFRLTNGTLSKYEIGEVININLFSSVSRKTAASAVLELLDNNVSYQKILFIRK